MTLNETTQKIKVRQPVMGDTHTVLTDIYKEEVNIAVWQRELEDTLKNKVATFLETNPKFQASMTLNSKDAFNSINEAIANGTQPELSQNIAQLVEMFGVLFDLTRVGLRLTALDRAMCPRFHVDKVPARLITTFQGVATQWLPHKKVNRNKMGHASKGLTDSQSGLYNSEADIENLESGDVALLKGEAWFDNENAGLVHRSPALKESNMRLLLTLDFVD